MSLTYIKRFRMEYDLGRALFPIAPPDPGYELSPWSSALLDAHAEAKFHSFTCELDANIFPCLATPEGCLRLMTEITGRKNFVPEATWLAVHRGREGAAYYCGTIQGLREKGSRGSVQNVGVTPDHRGRRLGAMLLWHALDGFRRAGLKRAALEVTAHNISAIRLYERLGFCRVKTIYKPVEVAYA